MAGTLTLTNILTRVEDTLQDTANVRWSEAELIRYVNDAQREIVNLKPDASATHANVSLTTGTEQSLPSGGLRLINVVRNMSSTSSTASGKRSIRLVNVDILNTHEPDWHDPSVTGTAAHGTEVKHFVFDEDDPKKYYVYPGVSGSAFVEIVYSKAPTDLSSGSDVIQVDDIYANAIVNYVLFRAYMKDAEYAGSLQRSGTHYQLFTASLGNSVSADDLISPNTPSGATLGGGAQ
tara:strand:+ start:8240 stop:8944 length:705 start_codon:yes stop_codon:yes gene_type:complete